MPQLISSDSKVSSVAEQSVFSESQWYAGYTAARHEKRVAEHLAQRGVEHFLPLYETIHHWKNGRHRVHLPLFPGYIFVRTALQNRLRIVEVPGMVRLVGFGTLPCPLPESDIKAMREALSTGVLAQPYPYLVVGTRVEIRNGPFRGMTGILLRRRTRYRVVISVELIQRSIAVEVEAGDVVPLQKRFQRRFMTMENAGRRQRLTLSCQQ